MATTIVNVLPALTAVSQIAGGVAGLRAGGRQADFQEELAAAAVEDRRRQARRLRARQRVAFAKGGVDVGTGSPADFVSASAAEEELSALRAGLPFDLRADQFGQQGTNALFGGFGRASSSLLMTPTLTRQMFGGFGPRPRTVTVPGGVTRVQPTILANPQPPRVV